MLNVQVDQLSFRQFLYPLLSMSIFFYSNSRQFHTKTRTSNRIGPHNLDVISVLVGCLLNPNPNPRTVRVNLMIMKRTFHTLTVKKNTNKGIQLLDDKISFILNHNWVTGFTDAEGSFIISILKNSERTLGWSVKPIFAIQLHERDIDTLHRIKLFFGVGTIIINKKRGHTNYAVKSVKDIYSSKE